MEHREEQHMKYEAIRRAIKARWDTIAKPLDGLGKFEEILCRIGASQGTETPQIKRRAVVVFCADNGIVARGVTQTGQEVTRDVASWMGRGTSSVCHMAHACGTDVIPVDVGISTGDTPEGVRACRVADGTRDFLTGPAMTEEECRAAIQVGIDLASECKAAGYEILATGEMGIGNTTTGAAVAAALLGFTAEEVTGRGAGLDDAGLARKRRVIEEALASRASILGAGEAQSTVTRGEGRPNDMTSRGASAPEEIAFRILCELGGLDIAGMAGLFIGGRRCGVPVVIDGFISAVAALLAERMEPGTRDFAIASHMSREPAMRAVLDALSLDAVIEGDMALGEGTGAVMLFGLLDPVFALYANASRFDETEVGQYERFEQEQQKC